MRGVIVLAAAALLTCSGCANYMTLGRRTDLPDGGKAIHLDAPQRLAYVSKEGSVCAEPSPDALQAYANSFGTTLSRPNEASVNLAAAFSENSASIGLRTQAITLMRDALYRICEAHHNRALGDEDVVQLLQRSQELTVGILAIEQLTGAVVARQVVLTTGANAAVTANMNSTQAEADKAAKDLETKKTALSDAKATLEKEQTAKKQAETDAEAAAAKAKPILAGIDKNNTQLAKDQKTLDGDAKTVTAASTKQSEQEKAIERLNTALAAAVKANDKPKEAALRAQIATETVTLNHDKADVTAAKKKRDAQKAKVDKLDGEIQAAKKDSAVVANDAAIKKVATEKAAVTEDEEKVTTAQNAVDAAQKVSDAAAKNVKAATDTANAAAQGYGALSDGSNPANINKDTVAQIAAATTQIVQTVVDRGHLEDVCSNMIAAYYRQTDNRNDQRFEKLLPLCTNVIQTKLDVYKKVYERIDPTKPPVIIPNLLPNLTQ